MNKFEWFERMVKVCKWIVILAVIGLSLLGGWKHLNRELGLPDDNSLEQALEGVIENQTGIIIDLS